jgi:hypothetical protein
LEILDVRPGRNGGHPWARVKFQSGTLIASCAGVFECEKEMMVKGQEYSGQLFQKKYKGRQSWSFRGKPSNNTNHLVNYQLHLSGVKPKVRRLLFKTFQPITTLFKVVENKRSGRLLDLQGVSRRILKMIETGCLASKKGLEQNQRFQEEFPKLYESITTKQREALTLWLGKEHQIITFLRRDPFRIIYDTEFDGMYTTEARATFLKQTKPKTRMKMAAAAAADLKLLPECPGRQRFLAIDVVKKHIQKTNDYFMPSHLFESQISEMEEAWPFIHRGNQITLQKYDGVERAIETAFEQVTANFQSMSAFLLSPFENQCKLDEHQCKAVEMACQNPIFILQGGAGVGKTTVCKEIVQQLGGMVTCAAPTGKAAQRLKEVTGLPAYTVHRLYHSDSIQVFPTILLDEQSMQEPEILAKMLRKYLNCNYLNGANQHGVNVNRGLKIIRLLFVGDTGQLTSVGPGQFLKDICRSNVPSLELTHIYRSGPKSLIASNGFKIRTGDVNLETSPESFEIIPYTNDQVIVDKTVEIEKNTKKRAIVLCNTNREVANINIQLRAKFNPLDVKGEHEKTSEFDLGYVSSTKTFLYPKWRFAAGDTVINIKNKYTETAPSTLVVANGDVGMINRVKNSVQPGTNRTLTTIRVGFGDDVNVTYVGFDEFGDYLRPAYALTVNKSQGSEYDVVIVKSSDTWGDKRERFYTAVTRAKEKCIVYEVGSSNDCCIRSKAAHRNTRLCHAPWTLPEIDFNAQVCMEEE